MQKQNNIPDENLCVYCNTSPSTVTEHVFPHGLGGASVYMNCVCKGCNDDFSKLERELYQKSPIALMRSVEGIQGYTKKNKSRKGILKYRELLSYDKDSDIVFEIGQSENFETYIKPQLFFKNDELYVDGPSKIEVEHFLKICKNWERNCLEVKINRDGMYRTILFEKSNIDFNYKEISDTKNNRSINLLIIAAENEFYNNLSPRLFQTTADELSVRARTIEEGIEFILTFLKYTIEGRFIQQFLYELQKTSVVNVFTSFDARKTEQALVKIGLNALIYNYPEFKRNPLLSDIKSFINTGRPALNAEFSGKSDWFDYEKGIHYIMFSQYKQTLNIRISLFSSQFIYSFSIPSLYIIPIGSFSKFIIDYKNRTHRFENMEEIVCNIINVKNNESQE